MRKYTTIVIDIDNIEYELYNCKYLPQYQKEMLEKLIKNGLRSLEEFELFGLVGKNHKKYITKNYLQDIKTISKEQFEKDIKSLYRTKKEILVVSGNQNTLLHAQMLGFDTCYFSFPYTKQELNIKTTITVKKLEELVGYHAEIRKVEENQSHIETLPCHYYIDPCVMEILKDKEVNLINSSSANNIEEFLNQELTENSLIITMNLAIAMKLKRKGYSTYFVNNHHNDNIDFTADFESSIEELPKHLTKVINEHAK